MIFPQAIVVAMSAILAVAALLAVVRIVKGPSIVDRAVGNDVLVSTIVCMLGLQAATMRDSSTLTLLVTLSLIGFVSSVAVGRFGTHTDDAIVPNSLPPLVEASDLYDEHGSEIRRGEER